MTTYRYFLGVVYMEYYYIAVISVALLLLILSLTYIGVYVSVWSENTTPYPPSHSNCPDYWKMSTDGRCIIPEETEANSAPISNDGLTPSSTKYTHGLTLGEVSAINFNDPAWEATGKTRVCKQREWSIENSVAWDGVSNFNMC